MTDKEFIKLLKDEIQFCKEQLDDCDDYDREFYEGAKQTLQYLLRKVQSQMEETENDRR